METLMKSGKVCEIYYNDETKKYEIKTDVSEITYIFSTMLRANNCFTELEKRYKTIKK